jgi:hypothetical protein
MKMSLLFLTDIPFPTNLYSGGLYEISFSGVDRAKNVAQTKKVILEIENLRAAPTALHAAPPIKDTNSFDIFWGFCGCRL